MTALLAALAALVPLLGETPTLIKDVEDVIAAFKSGGASAATSVLLAKQAAADTAQLETELQTPIAGASK
jgi:hypothetical protein